MLKIDLKVQNVGIKVNFWICSLKNVSSMQWPVDIESLQIFRSKEEICGGWRGKRRIQRFSFLKFWITNGIHVRGPVTNSDGWIIFEFLSVSRFSVFVVLPFGRPGPSKVSFWDTISSKAMVKMKFTASCWHLNQIYYKNVRRWGSQIMLCISMAENITPVTQMTKVDLVCFTCSLIFVAW